jgi:AcrR family transcriptional regulator
MPTPASAKARSRSAEIRSRARGAAEEVQREAIAQAACEVIATEGLEAASLRRIAEVLGSTTGLISHYFASNDDLLVRALEHCWRGLAVDWPFVDTADTPVTLTKVLDGFARSIGGNEDTRCFWLVLIAFRGAAIGSRRLAEVYESFSGEAANAMRHATAVELHLDADDPTVATTANAISVVIEAFGTTAAMQPEQFPKDTVRAQVQSSISGILAAAQRP